MFGQQRTVWHVLRLTLGLLALFAAMSVAAQAGEALELTETYTTQDGTFQFRYPAEWDVSEGTNDDLSLTGPGAEVTIYPPLWVRSVSLLMDDFSDAAGLLEAFNSPLVGAGLLETQATEEIVLATGIAARSDFNLPGANAVNSPVQFSLVMPVEDHYVMIKAVGDEEEPLTSTLYAMAESFVVFEEAIPTPVPMNIEVIRQARPLSLSETLVTQDGAFQFGYPAEWDVLERPDYAVELTADGVSVTIYTPNYLATSGLFEPDTRSTDLFLNSFIEVAVQSGLMTFGPPFKVALANEVTAFRSDMIFTGDESEGADFEEFVLAVPVDGHYVLILAQSVNEEAFAATVYAMAESFVILDDSVPTDPGAQTGAVGLPTDWQENVAILEDMGLIEGGGELLWSESYLTTVLGGPFVLDDESISNYPNVAGGVFVSFRPEEDINTCGLLVRVNNESGSEQALFVGLSALYELLVMDVSPETVDDPPVQWVENDLSFFNPQQLMYVLRDNRVTILINGEIVAEDIAVSLPEADARGNAPDGRAGALLEMSCVMTDAWAYGFGD